MNLCIAHSNFQLKLFTLEVRSKLEFFGHFVGKKGYYLALGKCPYKGSKLARKKSLNPNRRIPILKNLRIHYSWAKLHAALKVLTINYSREQVLLF